MVEAQSRLNTTVCPSEDCCVPVEWNSTDADYPRDRCVHQLIEATAAAYPDAVALRFCDRAITYRELNRRANHVALQLRSLGIAPEAVVGTCVERSPEAVVGFLAAMKAGAAYLPLNPTLPKERLAFMLGDAGVRVVLTQPHVCGCLPAFDGPIVDLVPEPASDRQYDNNPDNGVTPSNVAYIIYTSGSTGRQKGVLVEHGGLTNTVWAQIKAWGIQPDYRIIQFLNLSFDAAQAEIYRALVAGATLCIPPPETLPGRALFEFLRDERINLYTTLPVVLSTLPLDEELPDLHTLTLGGETCPAELAAHWHHGRKMLIGYGPTEASICATIAKQWQNGQPPPIGKPVANTQTYILDEDLSPVAIGTPGEIYIGGVGVARGYLNDPALTAERFLPDPFGNKLGARLYRTGDKGRWQQDGNIEFLGRFDDQVKIRGYRIEVGEIESTLGQHPNIRHAVVMPFDDIAGHKRLIGYIVAQRLPAPSPRALRQFIAGCLPAYMVPSTFVFLPEMPFTVNGKADRKALPPPDLSRIELDGELFDTQLAYWKEQLAGIEPMELPTDRVRPAEQRFTGAHETVQLPRELNERLTMLSRREGVTPFMTFLAAFQVLLSRYARQDDISVGTPIAGRGGVNTLVMRTDLSSNPTFRVLLKRVRELCLAAYDHQDIPFEKLVEELHPQREPGHNPIFQVWFVLQYANVGNFESLAKFDLALGLAENPDGVRTTLKYNAELFDATTIRRMLGHFQTLLHAIADHPEHSLATLVLMPESERQLVVHDWNVTEAALPHDRCVHEMFEDQARIRPDAVALRFYEQTLTYGELNRRANRLAGNLRRLGVTLESKVALVVDRSPEMILGILGILKAGGGYVPLDPAQPPGRQAFMLRDADVRVILTQSRYRSTLPDFDGEVVELDRLPHDSDDDGNQSPISGVGPNNIVYVIFTSGSTGLPKGVLVQHRGLSNICRVQAREFGITPVSRVMQWCNYQFDASQAEIFRTLTSGATLCLARADDLIPGPEMARMYRGLRITHATLPPSVLAAIPEGEQFPDMEQLCIGGEALPGAMATQWAKGRRLFNGYGPTETTICATLAHGWDMTRTPPIGRPISNAKAYVLDPLLHPAPIGIPGELYIGGIGVTRGYLQRPDLTAENFLPDPFSDRAGTRMYRTGDVVRWLADGQLDFMGRVDEQVKIRGFRIELGEIENTLLRHPEVANCAVVVVEDQRGDKWLVAYVAARQTPPLASELKEFLRGRLPEHMVPRTLMFMPVLPRRPNGKVDRKQLPTPDLGQPDESEHVAPRTPVEEIIASIWAELLKRDSVGVTDNFFDIGGHSLLATQVVSRLRTAFRVEVPLRAVFETRTVAALADHIEKSRKEAQGLQTTPIAPVPRDQDLPLSFAQQRLWFLDQLEPGDLHYAIPLSIRLTGIINQWASERALAEMVRRHEVLRTTFPMNDGQAAQLIAPADMLRLAITDLTDLPEAEREVRAREVATDEARLPFDLAHGPLLRARLVRLGAEDHALLLSLHHIVSDGWSMTIFFRELGTLYEAFAADRPSPLPDLHIQYADFAVWQRDWLRGPALETQLGYWREKLADIPTLNLPTDRSRLDAHRYRGANYSVRLPSELSAKLQALSRQEGATLFMTLLAAFQMLLGRECGQDDVSVGTPIAGRNRAETENLIGFFVNILVLRADLSGATTFRGFLKHVRETCLDAFAHQDVPFDKLVDTLQPERKLGRTLLYRAVFILQNLPPPALKFGDLTISQVELDQGTAKADIALDMTATGNGLVGRFVYNAELFEPDTISQLADQFETLLREVVANPDMPVKEFLGPIDDQEKVIPAPEISAPAPEHAHVPPRTETEAALARIWAAVLRCESIGVEDNFFSLGGDSISSIQVVARANRAGMPLTAKDIFEHQTIAKLAAVCESLASERPAQNVANSLNELDYWTNVLGAEVRRLPVDFNVSGTSTPTQTISRVLAFGEAAAPSADVLEIASPDTVDVLLTALLQAVEGWTGQRSLLVDVDIATSKSQDKGYGDIDRCSEKPRAFPLRLDLGDAGTPGEALQLVRERLRAVPNDGHGFAALLQSAHETIVRRIQALPAAEIHFRNHDRNDAKTKAFVIEVRAAINNDSLEVDWTYYPDWHRPSTIAGVATAFMDRLGALLDHRRSAETQLSAADFPEAGMSNDELEALLSQIGTGEEGHLS